MGQGKDCCIYLVVNGLNGFECVKNSPMKLTILMRASTMTAQGDNCEGENEL